MQDDIENTAKSPLSWNLTTIGEKQVDNDRIRAAKDLMRSQLEDLTERASAEYRHDICRQVDPFAEAIMTRHMIEEWRDKSMHLVDDCFNRFFQALGQSGTLAEQTARASELCWHVINEVFGWTENDRSRSDVLEKCFFDDPLMFGELDLPSNPAGGRWDSTGAAVSYEFWNRFDRQLKQLANDKLSVVPVPANPISNVISNGSAEGTTPQQESPKKAYVDPDLLSKDKHRRGRARARLVAAIKRELDKLRPDYFSDRDFHRVSARYPEFITFQVCADRKDLRDSLESIQAAKQYLWLAIRIAAAKLGKQPATIQDNWRRYHNLL